MRFAPLLRKSYCRRNTVPWNSYGVPWNFYTVPWNFYGKA